MATDAWDVVIIGAGAAGLMAAIRASERGKRVLLLEKNRKPGVKILMSGGTRCNITHDCDTRGIIEAFGPNGKFLHSALAAFTIKQTIAFFEAEGVATKVEDTGKIFPVSDKALDVLEALLRKLNRAGATLSLEEPVSELRYADNCFEINTPKRILTCGQVLLTTGGQSYPGCGTRGDGYRWATQFGHTLIPPKPALVPITVAADWLTELRGITLADVNLKVLDGPTTLLARRGGFLFAHFGLSGPAPLDVSRAISRHPQPQTLQLELDFLPTSTDAQVDDFLKTEALASGKKQLNVVLSERLPRRLCDALLGHLGQPLDRKATGLSKPERLSLVQAIKHLRLPIRGTLGFEKAEVTSGGIALSEVDSKTLQSKLRPGLFLAGEILDLDGFIGGYNFQAAWSTGWLVGNSVG